MAPATEIATLPLAAGATIEDPNSSAGKVWQSTLDTVSAQDGYQRAYYGREVENPSVVQLLVDWDSYDAHQNFIKSSIYGPFAKHLMSIVDGPLTMNHVTFDPHPPSAAVSSTSSPVTEVLTCYLTFKDKQFEANARKLLEVIKEKAEGGKAGASGWVIEDMKHEKFGSGKTGKGFVLVVGWESVEAHTKFRETDAFKENNKLGEGSVAFEVHHTKFVEE